MRYGRSSSKCLCQRMETASCPVPSGHPCSLELGGPLCGCGWLSSACWLMSAEGNLQRATCRGQPKKLMRLRYTVQCTVYTYTTRVLMELSCTHFAACPVTCGRVLLPRYSARRGVTAQQKSLKTCTNSCNKYRSPWCQHLAIAPQRAPFHSGAARRSASPLATLLPRERVGRAAAASGRLRQVDGRERCVAGRAARVLSPAGVGVLAGCAPRRNARRQQRRRARRQRRPRARLRQRGGRGAPGRGQVVDQAHQRLHRHLPRARARPSVTRTTGRANALGRPACRAP